jgi:hypothetical protein
VSGTNGCETTLENVLSLRPQRLGGEIQSSIVNSQSISVPFNQIRKTIDMGIAHWYYMSIILNGGTSNEYPKDSHNNSYGPGADN